MLRALEMARDNRDFPNPRSKPTDQESIKFPLHTGLFCVMLWTKEASLALEELFATASTLAWAAGLGCSGLGRPEAEVRMPDPSWAVYPNMAPHWLQVILLKSDSSPWWGGQGRTNSLIRGWG